MPRAFRRPLVIGGGFLIAALGLVLMPVPGPGGTPVFLAGLALLASEFQWARKLLTRFKEMCTSMSRRRRIALTFSALAFYALTGLITWQWMGRAMPTTEETRNA